MICIALRVHGVLTDGALEDVLFLLDMGSAPWAHVVVNQRTRPLVSVELVMTRVEIKVAFITMLCNDFRNFS
jgi:hypothetical protein